MKKKLLCVAMSSVLLFSAFGCSPGKDESSVQTADTRTDISEFTIINRQIGPFEQDTTPVSLESVSAYNDENDISHVFHGGRWYTKHNNVLIELHGTDIPDPSSDDTADTTETAPDTGSTGTDTDEVTIESEDSSVTISSAGVTYSVPDSQPVSDGSSGASARTRAAVATEVGWYEIIEEIIETGSYTIPLSGYSDAYGVIEDTIWSYLTDCYVDYYLHVLNFGDEPFDVTISNNQAVITLNDTGRKVQTVEDRVISMFGTAVYGDEWTTVRETMNRVMNGLTYDLAYEESSYDEVLDARRGVCWAFAQTGLILLNAEGIPARQMVGTVDFADGYHAWVEAYFGGAWHTVDFTWGEIDSSSYVEGSSTSETRPYEDVIQDVQENVDKRAEAEANGTAALVANPNDYPMPEEAPAETPADPADTSSQGNTEASTEENTQQEVSVQPAASPDDTPAETSEQPAEEQAQEEAPADPLQQLKEDEWARLCAIVPSYKLKGDWFWSDLWQTWLLREYNSLLDKVCVYYFEGNCFNVTEEY